MPQVMITQLQIWADMELRPTAFSHHSETHLFHYFCVIHEWWDDWRLVVCGDSDDLFLKQQMPIHHWRRQLGWENRMALWLHAYSGHLSAECWASCQCQCPNHDIPIQFIRPWMGKLALNTFTSDCQTCRVMQKRHLCELSSAPCEGPLHLHGGDSLKNISTSGYAPHHDGQHMATLDEGKQHSVRPVSEWWANKRKISEPNTWQAF